MSYVEQIGHVRVIFHHQTPSSWKKNGRGSTSEHGRCVYDDNDRALTLKLAGFSWGVTQRQKFQEQEKFQETKFFIKDRY